MKCPQTLRLCPVSALPPSTSCFHHVEADIELSLSSLATSIFTQWVTSLAFNDTFCTGAILSDEQNPGRNCSLFFVMCAISELFLLHHSVSYHKLRHWWCGPMRLNGLSHLFIPYFHLPIPLLVLIQLILSIEPTFEASSLLFPSVCS